MACGSDACAAIVTEPDVLPDGTLYRLVFVTSGTRNATSSNIADYNAFAQTQANLSPELAALNTTWTAIGSTLTIAARDNTSTNPNTAVGVAIYQLDGLLVANDNADLWDGLIFASINKDQLGGSHGNATLPWTGTHHSGVPSANPLGGSVAFPNFAQFGGAGNVGSGWVNQGSSNTNDGAVDLAPLYAISGVLTAGGLAAAVPEPATLTLWGLATLGCAIGAYRRRKAA